MKLENITSLRWEIESGCNLNCKHCFLGKNTDVNHLDKWKYIEIIQNLSRSGVKNIIFSTKEPLLNKYIFLLLDYCNKKNINTQIHTNGTLLVNKIFSEKLILSNPGSIYISLEGVSPKSNDYIRGKGVFKSVCDGITNLNYYMEKYHKKIPLTIQMTFNSLSIKEIEKIIPLFDELQIDLLLIGEIGIDGNAIEHSYLKIDRKEYIESVIKLQELYNKLHKKNFIIQYKALKPYDTLFLNLKFNFNLPLILPYCSILNHDFSLLPNGILYPCVSLTNKNIKFNINDTTNWIDVIKEKHEIRIKNPICKNCSFKNTCYICPSMNDSEVQEYIADCALQKKEILYYLEDVYTSNFVLSLHRNLMISINEPNIVIKQLNNMTVYDEIQITCDQNLIKLIFLLQEREHTSNSIVNNLKISKQKLIEIISPLIWNNIINIKKEENKIEY